MRSTGEMAAVVGRGSNLSGSPPGAAGIAAEPLGVVVVVGAVSDCCAERAQATAPTTSAPATTAARARDDAEW